MPKIITATRPTAPITFNFKLNTPLAASGHDITVNDSSKVFERQVSKKLGSTGPVIPRQLRGNTCQHPVLQPLLPAGWAAAFPLPSRRPPACATSEELCNSPSRPGQIFERPGQAPSITRLQKWYDSKPKNQKLYLCLPVRPSTHVFKPSSTGAARSLFLWFQNNFLVTQL